MIESKIADYLFIQLLEPGEWRTERRGGGCEKRKGRLEGGPGVCCRYEATSLKAISTPYSSSSSTQPRLFLSVSSLRVTRRLYYLNSSVSGDLSVLPSLVFCSFCLGPGLNCNTDRNIVICNSDSEFFF